MCPCEENAKRNNAFTPQMNVPMADLRFHRQVHQQMGYKTFHLARKHEKLDNKVRGEHP